MLINIFKMEKVHYLQTKIIILTKITSIIYSYLIVLIKTVCAQYLRQVFQQQFPPVGCVRVLCTCFYFKKIVLRVKIVCLLLTPQDLQKMNMILFQQFYYASRSGWGIFCLFSTICFSIQFLLALYFLLCLPPFY